MIQLASLTKIMKDLQYSKIILVSSLILLFTFVFCFCPDQEFSGLINIHEKISQIHDKISQNNHEVSIEKKKKKLVKTLSHYNSNNIGHYIFNRFYYVVVSTTMLGFGDIYPITFKTRILTIIYILMIFFVAFF